MTGRILYRAGLALRGSVRVLLLAAVLVGLGVLYSTVPLSVGPVHTMAHSAPQTDCASVFMRSMVGPDEAAARAGYQCLAPAIQQLGDEDSYVQANATYKTVTRVERAGGGVGADGKAYSLWVLDFPNGKSVFWVVTLGPDGKVISFD